MFRTLIFFCLALPAAAQPQDGAWVFPMPSGNLGYQLDERGQSISDFSNCGYRGGTEPLPDVAALIPQNRWIHVSPEAGDDTARIQAAIDSVSTFALDSNGWRGVVFLEAGEFQLADPVNITASGVVLKGAGDSETTGTRLRATATRQYSLIDIDGPGSRSTVSGTTRNLVQKLVPAGTRTFQVDSTTGLAVGHSVIVRRLSTAQWIADIGMDQLEFPWEVGSKNLSFDRTITRIDGDWITVDAPLPQTFESKYGGCQIWRYTWSGRIRQVGVEDIFGFSDYANATDEDHAWTFIEIRDTRDSWVRRVTSRYFGYAAVVLQDGGKSITVADSQCLDPISQITGGRRYSFDNEGAELCLFVNDFAREGRHDFVFGATVPGPNAFVECRAESAYSDSGTHHRWTVGGLFDNLDVSNKLNVANRGNFGTGHGWSGAFCTVWNSKAAGFQVRNPPTARNWLIGSIGTIQPSENPVGVDPPGTYDSNGAPVSPHSLYFAQLQQRLKFPGSDFREVWLGDIDQHSSSGNAGGAVNCDPAWLAQIDALGGAPADALFDKISANRHTAFTFDFPLAAGDVVVAASLNVSLRAVNSGADDDRLYLDETASPQTFADLGWNPIATGVPTVRQVEIDPALLADGRLNVALGEDTAVDFAVLHLQVRKSPVTRSITIFPAADAFVQGGTNSAVNFGGSTTLQTKDISVSNVNREAFLRWDLSGVSGEITGATVRLGVNSSSQPRNESSASFVPDDSWTEAGLTFDNKPASGVPFAQWIPPAGNSVEFSVTPQVAGELAGDRQLSLRVRSTGDYGSAGNVSYGSRENAVEEIRPRLILSVLDAPPTVAPIPDIFIPEDTATPAIPISVGDDADPADLDVTAVSSDPVLLSASGIVLGGNGADRTLVLTPAAGLAGVATITVIVSDGNSSVTAAFQLTVSPVNDPPVAAPGSANTSANQPVDIDLAALANDPDTPAAALVFRVSAASGGAVEIMPDGHTARFTPTAGFAGAADFSYTVTDTDFAPRAVLNYDFQPPDTPADATVADISGNGRDAAIELAGTGAVTYTATVPPPLAARHSQSLRLESSSAGIARFKRDPASADLDFLSSDWTISAWFKRAAASDQDIAFHFGGGGGRGGANELALTFGNGSSNTLLYLRNWNASGLDVDLAVPAAAGAWHHVAVTRGPSSLVLYVDGVPAASDNTFQLTFDTGRALVFGGSTSNSSSVWDRGYNGSIADAAIFSAALSPAEIARLATAPAANLDGLSSTAAVSISVAKSPATVTLGNLFHSYDGSGKSATATTDPAGLAVIFTYGGNPDPPSVVGSHAVLAEIDDTQFAGSATGTLVIADSIAAWRERYFQTPANAGPAADTEDPDGDGFTNASEYILGLDPTTADAAPLTISGASLDFTAIRAAGPGFTAKSRHYALETSASLAAWSAVPGYEDILANDQSITVPLPPAAAAFYRLRVRLE